jgi:hypothetical protein
VAPTRQLIGLLTSVLVHALLLAWALRSEPVPGAAAPVLVSVVAIERVELPALPVAPLAWEARAGSQRPGEARPSPEPPSGEASVDPGPEPAARPSLARPGPSRTDPAGDPPAPTAAEGLEPVARDEAPSEPRAPAGGEGPARRGAATGASEGRGSAGAGGDLRGLGDGPDHSAYGAELVRLVKAEIDTHPIPGLGPLDSIEVVLEVLPSGRLARRGLGKYDYARVVRSTLGPVRMRAILRRILRASERFPPHPSSFPRQRYVVGFTVNFRDHHG